MTDNPPGLEEGIEEIDFKSRFISPLEQRAIGGSLPSGDLLVPPYVEQSKQTGDSRAITATRLARQERGKLVGVLMPLDSKEQIQLHREGYVPFLELSPVHDDGRIDPDLRVGLLERRTGKEVTDPSILKRLTANPKSDVFEVDTTSQLPQHRVVLRPKILQPTAQ